ncbi:MAG: hypothetical protein JSR76_06670 [Verrucomicrobia bacterium]|nr:hypothetical protein [Verrucomicrobiota bacterium]
MRGKLKNGRRLFPCLILFLVFSLFAEPLVIAHRGGGENFPENTILAFEKALEVGSDLLELDVQVTKDGVLVVYHPNDLKERTDGKGAIALYTLEEIKELNAGYRFKKEEGYPLRSLHLKIPTLKEVLERFPETSIIIDLKSLPKEPLVEALIKTISDEEAKRLLFYATEGEVIEALFEVKPDWRFFEKREVTRQRLLELNQKGDSSLAVTSNWIGFELVRKMVVTEKLALGEGVSSLDFYLWSPEVVAYLKRGNPDLFIALFGINDEEAWEKAVILNVDGVYTDNPEKIIEAKKRQKVSSLRG